MGEDERKEYTAGAVGVTTVEWWNAVTDIHLSYDLEGVWTDRGAGDCVGGTWFHANTTNAMNPQPTVWCRPDSRKLERLRG